MKVINGFDAFLFDMDGTLIDSFYDWPVIRDHLEIIGGSLIDELNALPEPLRTERWRWIEAYEIEATRKAPLRPGVHELMALLRERGLRTALVTNNNDTNAETVINSFSLEFDCVLTRDSGYWKPSGASLIETMRRLGAAPEQCMAIGDSRHDVMAARAAGCGRLCILHERHNDLGDEQDLRLPHIPALISYLRGLPD
jgi:HAD superfamily hydrolase (TIGR01509 family)